MMNFIIASLLFALFIYMIGGAIITSIVLCIEKICRYKIDGRPSLGNILLLWGKHAVKQ